MNYCAYDSIIDMILYHVSATPDRVAVKSGEQQLTYRELNEHADRVAAYLEQKGAARHSIIAVAMERTVLLVAVCLGIMKHGSAYLPIDIEHPEDRINNLVNNAKVEHIFCDAAISFPQRFSDRTVNPQDIINNSYQRNRVIRPNKETPAYSIYTSGSTGEPKGVLISHGGLLNHTQWFIDEFGVTEADVILQRTSFSFDASVWELWTGLAAGACTVILPAAYAKHPLGILLTLQQEHISIAQFVPTLLRELVRLRQFEHMPCRLVFCGGESLTWPLVDHFFSKTRSQLVNLYGPTETTIDATFWRVEQDAPRDLPLPIGKPIRGMQVYLLDEHGTPVIQEQEGEIAIAGPGVAIGYVNTPSENALRFSTLNVDGKPVRIYKTGDIGIVSASGELSFLGRRDSQHKVNGHRVELLAIEQIVQQTPGVHCAAVYLDTLASGEKQICACYVAEANVETHSIEQRIIRAVSTQLPVYMHPSQLYSIANLPLLTNGKVNHNALREINAKHRTITPSIAVDTSTSDQLHAIWKEILSHQAISANSHFFECGATSLSVMMLLGRIANLFNIDLTPKDIFDHPILDQQVGLLNGSARQGGENSLLLDAHAWRKCEGEDKPGLAQLEILEKPPETPAYLENVVIAFYIRGECSVAKVREAFGTVLQQQPALRCSFELNSHGQWCRSQHALDEVPLPFHLINQALESDIGRTVADLIIKESLTAFDLRHPPLIRATYLDCQGTDDVLVITAHHIAFDGWSGEVLMDQLCAHYQSLLANGVPGESKYCLQYADYTDAQHQRLAEKLLDKHRAFWQETLKQLPAPFPLHGAFQRPQQFTYRSAVVPLNLDAQYPTIAKLCNRTGFSLYTVILTAFLVSLARNTGTIDLYVRSPVANRTDAALEPLVGYFVHPMVIRPQVSEWTVSLRLLERVNHCVLDAYGHAMLPPHIFEANCSPRSAAYGSRFPYWYNHHNYPSRQRQLGTSHLHGIGVPSSGIKTDVSLNTLRTESGLVGSLFYYRDAIPDDCVQALLDSFQQALSELLTVGL